MARLLDPDSRCLVEGQFDLLNLVGLPGAQAPARWVGATSSGAPASGSFTVGDFVVDQTGSLWVCTVAGSPGTWVQVGASTSLARGVVRLTSGNLTTASGSFVDATGVTVTATTGARRCIVSFVAQANCNTSGIGIHFDLAIDGTRVGGAAGLITYTTPGVGFNVNPSFTFMTDVLSAASHTFKIQWCTDGVATATLIASATGPAVLSVEEIP